MYEMKMERCIKIIQQCSFTPVSSKGKIEHKVIKEEYIQLI